MAKNIKIAYMISCYKLPEQVVKLVDRLDNEKDMFLIHVDKKTPMEIFDRIRNGLGKKSNVIFLSRHYSNNWGGYGHVRATLKAIDYLVEHKYDYTNFVVITGQDYPVRSTIETRNMIAKAKNSMEYFKMPYKNWSQGGLDRVQDYHYWSRGSHRSLRGKIFKKRAESILRSLQVGEANPFFYGGSSYFQIEKDAVDYIYLFLKANPGYTNFFRHTYVSDEIFFQTMLLNSKFKDSIKDYSGRYVDWSDPVETPKIIRQSDLSKIKRSGAIFARKFDNTIDGDAIRAMDQ